MLALIAGLLGPVQTPPFDSVVARTRLAFARHDFRGLLAGSPVVRLHLPDRPVESRLRGSAAAAVLSSYTRRSREVDLTIQSAQVVDDRFGYLTLQRRYRRAGIAEERTHRVLASIQLVGGSWRVVEIMLLE